MPEVHFVMGSGLGQVLEEKGEALYPDWKKMGELSFKEIPGLPKPKAPFHIGKYVYFLHKKNLSLCFQMGRLHGYEGLTPAKAVQTVTAPALAGTKYFVLTNISGSLRKNRPVGSIVSLTDHINFTGLSPLVGESLKRKDYFVDMSQAYDKKLTKEIIKAFSKKHKVFNGVYIGVLGPQYETPAEIKAFKGLGADVVGMSTVWEAIALRALDKKVSAFSVVSNLAAGLADRMHIDSKDLHSTFRDLIKAFFKFASKRVDNK